MDADAVWCLASEDGDREFSSISSDGNFVHFRQQKSHFELTSELQTEEESQEFARILDSREQLHGRGQYETMLSTSGRTVEPEQDANNNPDRPCGRCCGGERTDCGVCAPADSTQASRQSLVSIGWAVSSKLWPLVEPPQSTKFVIDCLPD